MCRTSPRTWEYRWECELSHHVEIRTTAFGFRQNWKFSAAFYLSRINKVLTCNLTNDTKIVHFTQYFDILRKGTGKRQFPILKLVDFIVNIWYTYYRVNYG